MKKQIRDFTSVNRNERNLNIFAATPVYLVSAILLLCFHLLIRVLQSMANPIFGECFMSIPWFSRPTSHATEF